MAALEPIHSLLSESPDAETTLAGLVALMPIPTALYSVEGELLALNQAFREMAGVELPSSYNILTAPAAVASGVNDLVRRALAGERVCSPAHWFDRTLLPSIDRKLGLKTWYFPVYGARGAVQYVATCCIDVTAELLLQEERDRQQALRNGSEEITIVSHPDGAVTYVSPSSARVLGYSPEELTHLGREILHPEDVERWREDRRKLFATPGLTTKAECRLRHKDGAYRWVSLTAIHLADHPTIRGIITHVHDITALKTAEEKQRQTGAMLEAALNVAKAVAWNRDLATGEATIVGELAQAFRMHPGMTPEEIVATYHPDDQSRLATFLASHTAPGRSGVLGERARMIRPDTGDEIWVELHGYILRDAEGKMIGTRGIKVDVTDRVRAEQAAARASELEAENRRIRAVGEARREMLSHLSHELRTPLNAIIGFGELLQDGDAGSFSEEQADFLVTIVRSARHLLTIINDLLDLASVEAGKLESQPELVDLPALMRDVCDALRLMAAAKNISLTMAVQEGLSHAVIDRRLFRQVLFNYASNAIRFTRDGGRVTVRALREGSDTLRLEVEDTGVGIAPEDIGRLFKEFSRLGPTHHGGTGLGLAIARGLVESAGGQVGAMSTPGRGSTFYAVLPRVIKSATA